MSSDSMSRAIETLLSHGSKAWLACSKCGGKALSIAVEATGLGGAKGTWESYKSADDFLLRIQTAELKQRTALLVRSTHVVLSAQHLHLAGIAHGLHKTGFSRPIATLSTHQCRECATIGNSLRLRPDATVGLDTEASLVGTIICSHMLDNKSARLQCSSGSCAGLVAKGIVLPIKAATEKTALPLAKMLYFSRKSKNSLQLGIVVWVVMESLPVVVLDDLATLFKTGDLLRTLNFHCSKHAQVFPRKCVVCNGEIATQVDAAFLGVNSKTLLLSRDGLAAHLIRCVHPCKICGV